MLREKGPTAVKRRFKNAVNCISVERISLKERKKEKKKKKRGQPHSPNLKSRNAFKLPHTAENNVQ